MSRAASVDISPEHVKRKADRVSRRVLPEFEKTYEGESLLDPRVWTGRYKFFSNQRVKDIHDTYKLAKEDPLRTIPFDQALHASPPEHRYHMQRTSSWNRFRNTATSLAGTMEAGHPNSFEQTIQRCQKYVDMVPKRELWAKHHFFAGGCNLSDSLKIYGKDHPRFWATDGFYKSKRYDAYQPKPANR